MDKGKFDMRLLSRLNADRRGVTSLEYSLIAALIAGAIVFAVASTTTTLATSFTSIAHSISGHQSACDRPWEKKPDRI
jgi:Flp pilus assembly pilin Flp